MTSKEPVPNNGKQVMPELAFELEEIFRTRLFSFPLDDHESAREIFRYLLDRGVPEDELAHVIQASTNSMTLWLYRTGLKKMVGEWIISWINKCYNQYLLKEASVRVRSKSAKDCQQCFKESKKIFQFILIKGSDALKVKCSCNQQTVCLKRTKRGDLE